MSHTFDQPGWVFDQPGATFDGQLPPVLWLSIASTPPLHVYAHPAALGYMPAGERAVQLLQSVGELLADVEGATPELSVTTQNTAGQSAELWLSRPPLRARGTLYRGSEVLFSGVVRSIGLGDTVATLSLEA